MKLEDILQEWDTDTAALSHKSLTEDSVNSVKHHSKYYRIMVHERLKLASLTEDRKILHHLKTNYYMGELDLETLKERNWKPFSKKILKSDLDRYVNADQEIINFNLKIAMQEEKVKMLKEIIDNLNRRSFTIRNIIEWEKFKSGEY